MIEILITATLRPEILDKTLRSFRQNLFRNLPARVIINVDPVGTGTVNEVLMVVNNFFQIKAVNLPETPHFGRAFQWVWSNAEADVCFHLEDDWQLLRPMSLTHMIEILFAVPDLATLRLPWRPVGQVSSKQWKFYFPWTEIRSEPGGFKGGFFECPRRDRQEVGWCSHPSLVRGVFVKKCAKLLDPKVNPEKQFHGGNDKLVKEVLKWRYGVYSQKNQPEAIRDLGRDWMIQEGYRKKDNKAWFINWRRAGGRE